MRRRESFLLLAAFAASAWIILSACGSSETGGAGEPTPTISPMITPTEPEEALRLYVLRRLSQGFVPNCDDAERPGDVGKQCARFLDERDGMRAYALGPTFAGYTRIIILVPRDGSWTIAAQTTVDPNQPISGIPWPLEVGAEVVVAGTAPECLKVREQPGIGAAELDCLDDGTEVTINAGPVDADDIIWWQLEGHGWAASDYLRYPDSADPLDNEVVQD